MTDREVALENRLVLCEEQLRLANVDALAEAAIANDVRRAARVEVGRLHERVKRLEDALRACVIWRDGEPYYYSRNGVPMEMPERIARKLRPLRADIDPSDMRDEKAAT